MDDVEDDRDESMSPAEEGTKAKDDSSSKKRFEVKKVV